MLISFERDSSFCKNKNLLSLSHTFPTMTPDWVPTALNTNNEKVGTQSGVIGSVVSLSGCSRDAVVYNRNRVLRIGKVGQTLPTVTCVPYYSGTQPIVSSRITIVTLSWQILLCRIKIVTLSCVVGALSGRCRGAVGTLPGRCRDAVGMNWHDFEKSSIMPFLADWVPIMSRSCRMRTVYAEFVPEVIGLHPDSVPIIPNMATVECYQHSRHNRFTVLSLSVLCRIAFGRIGTLSGRYRDWFGCIGTLPEHYRIDVVIK